MYGSRVYPKSKHLFGTRKITNIIQETKPITKVVHGKKVTEDKVWSFFEKGPFEWQTYRDVLESVNLLGSGLVSLGLKKQDKVTIFHSTSADWMVLPISCIF